MNPLPLQRRRAALALALMVAAAGVAWKLTPTTRMSELHGGLELEQDIPTRFADWRVDPAATGVVVSPQQAAQLSQLYSQTLARTYVNGAGQRVMLAIAYGNDQRDGLRLHYPEVCYPAQGFQLNSNQAVSLQLADARIPARRLETVSGEQRYEPVTYWTVIGDKAVLGGWDKRLVELNYGFAGLIPDGLLFRISSIERVSALAFAVQQDFARDLVQAMAPGVRKRVAGV